MKNSKKIFIGKAHVGIDVHKTSWRVCVLGDGGFKKEFSCNPEVQPLVVSLTNLLPEFEFACAYEAGFSGFWLADSLNNQQGFSCIIVNPADIPTSDKERAQKEDRRDARKIASQLKAGALSGIYLPKEEDLALRELQRLRITVTKDLVRTKARIKSFLFRQGVTPPRGKFPDSKSSWSTRYITWLSSVEFTGNATRYALDQLLSTLKYLMDQKKAITKQLNQEIAQSEKSMMREAICEIAGIGEATSAAVVTEIHDIKRFTSNEKFHSFIGLVPSTNSSAEVEKIRGITNRANKQLRCMLVESAWIAIKKDTDLFHYYHELKQRMKPNKAIIRVAKKLATRIRYVLMELERNQELVTH